MLQSNMCVSPRSGLETRDYMYLQYAEHCQFIARAKLSIGLNDGEREKKEQENKRRFLELPWPRAES